MLGAEQSSFSRGQRLLTLNIVRMISQFAFSSRFSKLINYYTTILSINRGNPKMDAVNSTFTEFETIKIT